MFEPLVSFVAATSNAKTGPIPVVTSQSATCPPACPFKKNGCYAESGNVRIHWNRLDGGKGIAFSAMLAKVRDLPRGQMWRMNVAGDLQGANDKLSVEHLEALTAANRGRNGYAYTHYPTLDSEHAEHNAEAIAKANAQGFTVNLSGNSIAHADRLHALGIAPVATLVPSNSPHSFITPAGNKVVICPAQTREEVTCQKCRLCTVSTRKCIVGFLPHGISKKKVEKIANE